MSSSEYYQVRNTRLADIQKLPSDLLERYLQTCPKVVRRPILKLKAS
ncbi:hypothetical protein [Phytohalomonas tamaricis]|nr:hypothetical protein [Phytohalomonas tamaricis]